MLFNYPPHRLYLNSSHLLSFKVSQERFDTDFAQKRHATRRIICEKRGKAIAGAFLVHRKKSKIQKVQKKLICS
ncbi:hypothetical protein B9Z55_019245 [Caenorhabditis nigoni]|uniref:Uncharacterized protein n=1 Tax=Caenorhabditis nigoni TaxID=1611254 RepID=A0A2G5THM4_9PELO|nr:hypothetical protein B9Z55_019245 [Caenorhabditis nigoni]